MRYLTVGEILELHAGILRQAGTLGHLRDVNALESAVAQPRLTFDGRDLYPTLIEKAAVLGFAIIQGHPFSDGNKRVGHAAMETFLVLNGHKMNASVAGQVEVILGVASSKVTLASFTQWLRNHTVQILHNKNH